MRFISPKNYHDSLGKKRTIELTEIINNFITDRLLKELNLIKVRSPLIYSQSSGLSDNFLNILGTVDFLIDDVKNEKYEVVRSATKWKRQMISDLELSIGEGILTEATGIKAPMKNSQIYILFRLTNGIGN